MNSIFYSENTLPSRLLNNLEKSLLKLPWCRPPSGIPGNRTPRNVAVLGDGSTVKLLNNGKVTLVNSRPFGRKVAYPLFQSSKDCSALYKTNKFTSEISQTIIRLREIVKEKYGNKAINIDKMFNIAICNFYTEKEHKINEHRDDERWLEFNELDKNGDPCASIIASMSFYPDNSSPSYYRNFEIYDENNSGWKKITLKHNSLLLFSNHRHRCKGVPKRKENVRRINITFRTITSGLLGFVGYSNFYRYMSIPYAISFTENKYSRERVELYKNAAREANIFNNRRLFIENNIRIKTTIKEVDKSLKKADINYNNLPRYVKSLCSVYNIKNFNDKPKLRIKITLKI